MHSSPGDKGGGRQQETGQDCAVEKTVYARHKAARPLVAALGETLTRGGEEGKGALGTELRKETSRKLSRSASVTGV